MNHLPAFFSRIGMAADTVPELTPEFLAEVHYRAVLAIPYENMDILKKRPILLDGGSLYEKIVTNGRGGYCFESNALLHHMLAEMGFSTKSCFARFLRGETEIPLRRHRILIVTLGDKRYFCDIGIGQIAPRLPLLLEEGAVQGQFGETYRFERDEDLGWVLCDLHKGAWRRFISFTEETQYEVDFIEPSFYCEAHPASPFNKTPIIALKTADGRKTINDREYKIFQNEQITHIEENITDARFDELLRIEFGIYLD